MSAKKSGRGSDIGFDLLRKGVSKRSSNWLKKQGLPEHLLGWPLVLVPLVSAVQAGLGTLWHKFS